MRRDSLPKRRFEEVAAYLKRALESKEAKLDPDDVKVAEALTNLADSLRSAGRRGEAVACGKRVFKIKEAMLGQVDESVVRMNWLCSYTREARQLVARQEPSCRGRGRSKSPASG